MREIKFRAWDNGVMLGPVGILLTTTPAWLTMLSSEADIMLYTGLKDKNGKEIYEGDILKWEVPPVLRTLDYKTPRPDNLIYICTWMERQCAFIFLSQHNYPHNENYFVYHVQDDLEIIGNLYEHPELIGE